jgi:predicted AAA+ superfamily ATPase
MNQLAEIDAPVMVIGKREGGKTTFIRSFLRRVDEQGLVITGSPKKTQLIELNNKVSVCVDNKKEFTALKRRNFIIFIDDVSEEKDVSIA